MQLVNRTVTVAYISGAALRAQRRAAGLSQQELAARLRAATGIQVAQQQVSRWEDPRLFEFGLDMAIAAALAGIFEQGKRHKIGPGSK